MTDSNRLRLTSIREVTLGTTPGTPRMRTARIRNESLAISPQFVNPEELRDDRMDTDQIKVNETNGGGIDFALSYPVPGSPLSNWFESAMFNPWNNMPEFDNDGTADSVIEGVTDSSDTFTVVSGGGGAVANHLARMTGFAAGANNGLFKVDSSTATTIVVAGTPTLVDDTAPAANARIKIVGFEGDSGDVTATATGLASTSLDFTTLGLAVGQWIKIGGTGAAYRFATEALNTWARITAIAATALTLDNLPSAWTTDNGSGKTIRVFAGDYIRNGVTTLGETIERGFMGQQTPTYVVQTGMVAGQLQLNIASDQPITGSFNFTGMGGSVSTTTLDATPDAATTNRAMAANANVGRIAESGALISAPNWARSLSIQLNNNLRQKNAMDTVGAVDIGNGTCSVSGTVTTYFGSATLLQKLLAGEIGALNSRFQKDNQAVVTTLPRLTFTDGTPNASGRNTDVELPLQWSASVDSLTNCHIQFDRIEYYEA